MVKYKNGIKPNLIKLSVNAKCHHGIRHPRFLMSRFKSRQHRPAKRCAKTLNCPKTSRATHSIKFKDLLGNVKSEAPTTNGLPPASCEGEEMGRCRCKETSLERLMPEGCETFSTVEMFYDSFLDDTTNPHCSESDMESDNEPLYRSFSASLLGDTSVCELITAVNGNRISPTCEKDSHILDSSETDDDEDDIDSPVARLTDTTDSENVSSVQTILKQDPQSKNKIPKVDQSNFPHCSFEQPAVDAKSHRSEENGQLSTSSEWEDLEESSYEQTDETQTDSSPSKRGNMQLHKAKHRIYSENANSFVLILDHPAKLSLAGKIQVSVLWGCLSINGFYLKPRKKFYPIYSPSTNSSVVISTYHEGTAAPSTDSETKAFKDFWKSQNVQLIFSSDELSMVLKKTVGLHCKRLPDTACSYVERFFPNLFGINHNVPGFFSPERADHYGCQLYNAHQSNIRFIKSDNTWKELVDDIVQSTQHKDTPPRIIVCGGKRVGKSTLCRYLLNSLLNVCDKVSFMDGDPGQCEFTPSGLVSLMEITEPCFGPAFTHLLDAKLSFFVGGTTVANSPNHFIECICELWGHYSRNDSKQQPLLINTMGWNKGMGLELLMDMIRIIQPTHVIQINSPLYLSKNFSSLSLTNISKTPGWEFDFNVEPYAHYILKSQVHDRKDLSQASTRLISLLSYFSRLQEPSKFQPLNQLKTFKVPWSSMALHVCQANVLHSQILYVYNASIVALCSCDDNKITSSTDPTLPKFIREIPVCKFFDYGIVRGISMEEKCFYIITSLDSENLKKVNALLMGSIAMPQQLLLEQDVGGPIPYLLKRDITSTLKIGHKSVPRRNFIGKSKRMSPKKSRNQESPNFMPLMGQPLNN